MEARELKAQQIVAGRRVVRFSGFWMVHSQSTDKRYKVTLGEGGNACTCTDHELTGKDCKHILAVISLQRTSDDTPPPVVSIPRKSYPQNWPKYNAAQCSEKDHVQALLADLCRTVPEPPRKPGKGRKPIPMADAIFAACFKVFSGYSARRFTCDLEEAHRRGHLSRTMHYNIVLKGLENPALTPILYDLIGKSALPLREVESTFAADSTGFCTTRYTRWLDVKYGTPREEADWVKLHALVGTKTNAVVAAVILDKNAGDSPQFPSLVAAAAAQGFKLAEVTAGKAYASRDNFAAVDRLGGTFYPAFKNNTNGAVGGLFEKAFHLFCLNREDYLRHYHQRSNVESTFSMVKRKFGDSVLSKSDVAMTNEVLCKLVCHNLSCLVSAFHELGITPTFAAVPEEEVPAIIRFPG